MGRENAMKKAGFFSKFNKWLLLIPMIPASMAGISKGVDIFRYDILNQPRNSEERNIQHMIRYHFGEGEDSKSTTLEAQNGSKAIVHLFNDGCITMKRITREGLPSGLRIIPDPEKENDISLYDSNVAYAGAPRAEVDLGAHSGDSKYKENMRDGKIEREYSDGCVLVGYIGKYGNVDKWEWVRYKH